MVCDRMLLFIQENIYPPTHRKSSMPIVHIGPSVTQMCTVAITKKQKKFAIDVNGLQSLSKLFQLSNEDLLFRSMPSKLQNALT